MSSSTATSSVGRPTRQETRQRLLDSAYETFCEVGFQAATIEEVCTRAGFTRGAFYSNFSSLDELLLDLWERTVETTAAEIRRQVAATPVREDESFERALGALIALRAPDRAWFVLSTEFLLHSLRTPGLGDRLERHREHFRAELRRGVAELMAADGLLPPEGIDVEAFTLVLVAGHLGCQHLTATGPGAGDIDLARTMLRALVAGCRRIDDTEPADG